MAINTLEVKTREEWRKWLIDNSDLKKEIWLVFYKITTGKQGIGYQEALEEALCFGWIDSLIRRLDDETYARKFTVRTNWNKWSEINIRLVRKLHSEGKIRKEIELKIPAEILENGEVEKYLVRKPEIDPGSFVLEELSQYPEAFEQYKNLAPSHKKRYSDWIMSAKKTETRKKRILEAVEMLSKGIKTFLK